jgi:DMSO/TMAO reductase YedYZ molybdopterin-dependent catalytic subunit
MNGNPLPRHHGYPARLIVPGWYGMASVKWVKEIEVISDEAFRAFFNGKKYVYIIDKEEVPVTDVRVKSLVTYPADGDMVEMRKPVAILGKAWSGDGLIERVEVCIEGRWIEAMLEQPMGRYAWTTWRAIWTPNEETEFTISVRATDEKGNVQPNQPELNQYQYGYNALHRIRVRVR